jgi:protein O-GlcNAc transferase
MEFAGGMSSLSTTQLIDEALALHRRGALTEAAARYAQALRRDPGNSDVYYYMGMMACQEGRFEEGAELAHKSLVFDPRNPRAQILLGRALGELGRSEEALACFEQAIAVAPDLAQAHASRADVLADLGRHTEAVESYDRALRLAPQAAEDWVNRGLALYILGRREEAIASYDRAIEQKPTIAGTYLRRAKALSDLDRHDDALRDLAEALRIDSGLADAWLLRAGVLAAMKRYDESLAACERALAMKADSAEAWLCRSNIFLALKRFDEALVACEQALAVKTDFAEAYCGRGSILFLRTQYSDALIAYEQALSLRPAFVEACIGRGNVYVEVKRYDEALVAYDGAISVRPDQAEAWAGRGNALAAMQQDGEALAAYDRAVALKSDSPEGWLGRGNIFFKRKQYQDALRSYERALALNSDCAAAWLSYGSALLEFNEYDRAFVAYDKAATLDPELNYAQGHGLFAKLNMCDWTSLEANTRELLRGVREQKAVSVPFALLSVPSTPSEQRQCAERYVKDHPMFAPIWHGELYAHDRVRIAYLSADFRDHPVAYLIAGVFEHHDRSRFEVTGLSFGPDQNSAMRSRVACAFERFIDVQTQSDAEIAEIMRRLEIDIAVDLMGYTQGARLGIFGRRPAPIQANYLGYPGTTGATFIDYILADSTVIPAEDFDFYSERVIWLPDSYQANDDKRQTSDRNSTRAESGLPQDAFVFCCFNRAYKITPEVFDIWMRLLAAKPNSVLWLLETNSRAAANLRRRAEQRGIAANRLIFAPNMPQAGHLARSRHADLFLDTLPYNAHTTASDALWAGVPVLTCVGKTFAGRVAASLLQAIGLPELITASLKDYEALASKLAQEPSLLQSIRAKLERNRNSHPLFNTARLTRHLEAAYSLMWQRQQTGEPPAAFAVNPIEQSSL